MAAENFATAAQVVAETAKNTGFFAKHLDKVATIAKAHPAAAVGVGVVGAALLGAGGYYGLKKAFGGKAKAAAKPAEVKPEAANEPEAPKEDAAAQ